MRHISLLFLCSAIACASKDGPRSGSSGDDATESTDDTWRVIEPLHPAQGAELTDIALSFSWRHLRKTDLTKRNVEEAKRFFQLQVDDDLEFESPEIDTEHTGPKATYKGAKKEFSRWAQISHMAPELLPPGDYHWRVRLSGGEWSTPVSFHINDDHTQGERVREISPSAPLFSFDMFFDSGNEGLLERIPEIHNRFPESVRDLVVFAIQNETIGMHPKMDDGFDGTFTDLLQPFADADVPVMIKTGGPDKDFQQFVDLAELEHIYQTQPNVVGLVQGETFWDFIDGDIDPEFYEKNVQWYRRSFLLSAKYGRVVIVGNGNDEFFAWDHFLGAENEKTPWIQPDEIRALSSTIIPTAKNNIPFNYYNAESIIMGAWLAGMSDNWGLWSEGWAWGSIGYDSLFGEQLKGNASDPDFSTMPYNLWLQMKLAGLSQGATVFHFGGESSVVEWGEYDPETGHFVIDEDEVLKQSTAFWDMEGNEHPALAQYIFPFLEAVVEQSMIPDRAEVLGEVKIAVAAPKVESRKGSGMDYGIYAPLFLHTVGIDGYISIADAREEDRHVEYYEMTPNACRRELLHNNGRYLMPAILPYPLTALSDDTAVLSVEDLEDAEALQSQLNAAYPAFSTGSAWVSKVGPRIYISNGHENSDIAEDFSLEIDGWGTLSGTIQPHSYMLVRIEEESLWIMANGDTKGPYTDSRSTDFSLSLSQEPTVQTLAGSITTSWEGGISQLSFSHATGAAEARITR
jgi:hypothetical protein